VLTPPVDGGLPDLKYFEKPFSSKEKGFISLNKAASVAPTEKGSKPHSFAIASRENDNDKLIETILCASSGHEMKKWLKAVQDVLLAVGAERTLSANSLTGKGDKAPLRGGSTAEGTLGAPASSLEKMARLEEEEMRGLKIKNLKSVLEYLSIEVPDTDRQLKEMKINFKGQMTKKEMEDEIKGDLVRLVLNQRAMVAQAKKTQGLWR